MTLIVPTIRSATEADLPRILELINEAISHTTSSFDLSPKTIEERRRWMGERREQAFPVLVAEQGGVVMGFGSFARFRPWQGYRHSVEHSIYVDPRLQRRGAGRALLQALMTWAGSMGMHVMIAGIEGDNVASLELHRQFGFVEVGRLHQVGRKFDRWLDLVLMQKNFANDAV